MAVAISADTVFQSDNIRVGYAELIAGKDKEGRTFWELPGKRQTTSKELAEQYAEKMDRMIKTNMKKLNRSLI